jgi:hypothetical protein
VVASTFVGRRRFTVSVSSLLLAAVTPGLCESPEQRAIDYLAREVPRWAGENKCYSCHNNGDGARALYAAARLGYRLDKEALSDTTRWLLEPSRWDKTPANPAISDKKLARIQFAASLASAYEAGFIKDRTPLIQAAELLVHDQRTDGCWTIDDENNVGSPVTYGETLATVMSLRTLERADEKRFARAIERAAAWLKQQEPRNVLDTAATLMAVPARSADLLDGIARAQTGGGGWGPQLHAPPEPFDTAMVLLALRGLKNHEPIAGMIRRGRAFLVKAQLPSGGWPETTRPPGSQSYAQHISTSAWATLALLAIDAERQ